MTIEIGLIISLVGCAIGVITFFIGRQTAAKNSGQEWGELKADIKYIKEDIAEIKPQVKFIGEQYSKMHTDVAVIKRDLNTAFTKLDEIRGKGI